MKCVAKVNLNPNLPLIDEALKKFSRQTLKDGRRHVFGYVFQRTRRFPLTKVVDRLPVLTGIHGMPAGGLGLGRAVEADGTAGGFARMALRQATLNCQVEPHAHNHLEDPDAIKRQTLEMEHCLRRRRCLQLDSKGVSQHTPNKTAHCV